MNVLSYWSFLGRFTRIQWWRFQIWTTLALAVLLLAVINIQSDRVRIALTAAAIAAWVLAALSVSVKRLHDRNKRASWLIVFYLVPLLSNAAAYYVGQDDAVFLAAPAALLSLWAMVELGFLRGTPGPNAYGDDPVSA
jgi:uncharacterized membrane protein YhaH (DUF805 family)